MKIFKNRTVIGITAIIAALLIFFGIGPLILGQTAKQVEVARVTKEIPQNTKITGDMLETVSVGSYNMPASVVKDKSDIVGKYSTVKMLPGDYVSNSKISAQQLGADAYLSKLTGEKVAVSIAIKSFANGLSGKLETGDIISLDVVDYGDMKQQISDGDLQYVQLLAATTDTGTDNDRSATQKKQTDNTSSKQDMPSTLTVLVSPEQKKKLEEYNANGTIHAALVYRGDKATAQKFLDTQNKYLANHSNQQEESSDGSNGK